MTVTREQIVACARGQLGVMWQHQAASAGTAVDCIGLVRIVAGELFGIRGAIPAYGRTPHNRTLELELAKHLTLKGSGAQLAAVGDVLIMSWLARTDPHHAAIVTQTDPIWVLHSYAQVGRVVEHPLNAVWLARIRGVYGWPGVT